MPAPLETGDPHCQRHSRLLELAETGVKPTPVSLLSRRATPFMDLTLTTPALLFPAISLLLLAYTNRFLVLAQLIRGLHDRHRQSKSDITRRQIGNLRWRVELVRLMQLFGVIGFILCTLSMAALFYRFTLTGEICFGVALVSMVISLLLSLWEVAISVDALRIELEDMQ